MEKKFKLNIILVYVHIYNLIDVEFKNIIFINVKGKLKDLIFAMSHRDLLLSIQTMQTVYQ